MITRMTSTPARFARPVALALCAVPLVGHASAGVVYTDRVAFEAAVASASLVSAWTEDFEGFASGVLPLGPTVIGGGSAEIAINGQSEITADGLSPLSSGQAWLGSNGGVGDMIQGVGGASLGLRAFGFDYFAEFFGGHSFNHSGGVDTAPDGFEFEALFIGWIGGPGETLDFVNYTPLDSAHAYDNFAAYVVPAPGGVAALALGGLVATRRRR